MQFIKLVPDNVATFFFQFLYLDDHFRFSRTCKTLKHVSGIPGEKNQPLAWNKHLLLTPDQIYNLHLKNGPLSLGIRGSICLTNISLSTVFDFTSLQTLDLTNCCNITDKALILLNISLTSLTLKNCSKITDIGLSYLSDLPLTYLNLGECRSITDIGLSYLSYLQLTYLNLNMCSLITDKVYRIFTIFR